MCQRINGKTIERWVFFPMIFNFVTVLGYPVGVAERYDIVLLGGMYDIGFFTECNTNHWQLKSRA